MGDDGESDWLLDGLMSGMSSVEPLLLTSSWSKESPKVKFRREVGFVISGPSLEVILRSDEEDLEDMLRIYDFADL